MKPRRRAALGFAVAAFLPATAHAVGGINPLATIWAYESGGNPTAASSVSGSHASGLSQFQPGTWAEALSDCGGACGTLAEYPTAASAPASVQAAATAARIDAAGLGDWTCSGCDPALTAAFNAAGGTGAYETSGLSTNPADYASLDTAGGVGAYMAANGAGPGYSSVSIVTGPDGSTTTVAGASSASVTSPGPAMPFSWTYSAITSSIAGEESSALSKIQRMASGPVTGLAVLAIIIMGIAAYMGRLTAARLLNWVIRLCFVVLLTQVGSAQYTSWVMNGIGSLPGWFASSLTGSSASPAAVFDTVLNAQIVALTHVYQESSWSMAPLIAVEGLVGLLFTGLGLLAIFGVYMTIIFLLALLLTTGPAVIVLLLFPVLDRWVWGYVNVVFTFVLLTLLIDVALLFFGSIMTQLLTAFAPTGSASADAGAFIGAGLALFVMSMAVAYLALLASSIGGGIAIAMEAAAGAMRGTPVARFLAG